MCDRLGERSAHFLTLHVKAIAVREHGGVEALRLEELPERALPLARAAEAQKLLENRAQFGKIVLNP